VFARAGHPLAGSVPDAAALAGFPWTVPGQGAPLRDSFERFFGQAGLELPSVPIESGSVMMIRQILIDSDFLTMLSPDQVAAEIAAGWLVQIAALPAGLARNIGVTTRASWRPTVVQQEFLEDLAAAARAMGPD
jgi:LysR family transcriptional regulator, regulator for genes of the gallate degradation pathway